MKRKFNIVRFNKRGFSLVEMLVAMAVLSLILVIMFQITSSTNQIWQHTRARISTFQEARNAFEAITGNLSQAMMNTYWDYVDSDGKSRVDLAREDKTFSGPKEYRRQAELHFVTGVSNQLLTGVSGSSGGSLQSPGNAVFFQAPLGVSDPALTGDPATQTTLPSLVNALGYFLEYADDGNDRPDFLVGKAPKPRSRLRLIELRQASEDLGVYDGLGTTSQQWFVDALAKKENRHVVAENIIALALIPRRSNNDPIPDGGPDPLSKNYSYDSRAYLNLGDSDPVAKVTRNQLPPMVRVIMVAIDEKSAARLEEKSGSPISSLNLDSYFKNYSTPTATSYTSDDDAMKDIQALEDELVKQRINYRVFSTDVNITQAKWSE